MKRLKQIGVTTFYTLALLGLIDMIIQAVTDRSIRLIHIILQQFFPR